MPLAATLAAFRDGMRDCDDLLAYAHRRDGAGKLLAPARQREQMISTAVLACFATWEQFMEASFIDYMTGDSSLRGSKPVRWATPPDRTVAHGMLRGTREYFEFGNMEYVLLMAKLFFDGGGPFALHLPQVARAVSDVRAMRNAAAHNSVTAQSRLDLLAQKVMGPAAVLPCNIAEFVLLQHPAEAFGVTVLAHYQRELDVVAEFIANG